MIASRKIERLSESAKVLQAQLKPDSVAELDHMQCNIRNEEQVSLCCTGLDNKFSEFKIVNIFLPISLNVCFGCSKEPSHQDGSFEYPQHMFWLRNKKNIFCLYAL